MTTASPAALSGRFRVEWSRNLRPLDEKSTTQLWRTRFEGEAGNAIVEFVFVAILVLIPLGYLVAAVATIQRAQLAVTQAARDAGRAFATSDTAAEASVRVRAAVRLALHDQGLPDDADVRFVAAGADCDTPTVTPHLAPGAQFTVCVTRRVDLPAIPSLLPGRGVTTTGAYTVHVDDFRELP